MSFTPNPRQLALIKAALFALCLLPLAPLLHATWNGDFGPNPVEYVQRWTGTWTINLLVLTLCVTPLRVICRLPWLTRLRRMLGLFCFFYALLHFLAFIGFDHEFAVDAIAKDIFKRPFVTAGFAAFVLLIPLAATSNQWAIRRLGGRRWQELHRSIYPLAIIACVHYFWLVKATALLWPLAYGIAIALLLGWRVRERQRKAIPAPRPGLANAGTAKPLKFFSQRPK